MSSKREEEPTKGTPRKLGELKGTYPAYDPEADRQADQDVAEMFDKSSE